MSLMENVSDAYSAEDGQRVEAIAKTLMLEFYGRVLTAVAAERTTLRAMAQRGEPRAPLRQRGRRHRQLPARRT